MRNIEDNIYCNLIEDLLPLYIENLVNEETRKEIDKHLSECEKCKEHLNNMQTKNVFYDEENNINDINENREKEIKCIKNIRRKMILKIVLAIIITSIVVGLAVIIYSNFKIIRDENGKISLYNRTTGNMKNGLEGTNIIAKYTVNDEGVNVETTIIFTFNKFGKCINARELSSGYDEQKLEQKYNYYINEWKNSISNVKIENEKLYMNRNFYIGKSKEQVIESLKEYNVQIIEL